MGAGGRGEWGGGRGEWQELVAPDGQVYYHNSMTNITTWNSPPPAAAGRISQKSQ